MQEIDFDQLGTAKQIKGSPDIDEAGMFIAYLITGGDGRAIAHGRTARDAIRAALHTIRLLIAAAPSHAEIFETPKIALKDVSDEMATGDHGMDSADEAWDHTVDALDGVMAGLIVRYGCLERGVDFPDEAETATKH